MTNDPLIRSLVADLRPVHRLPAAGARCLRWAAFALLCVATGAYAAGLRADLFTKLHDRTYVSETAWLLLAFVLAARATFRTSVPGVDSTRVTRILPFLAMLTWLMSIVTRYDASLPCAVVTRAGLGCAARTFALALIPALALLGALRGSAVLEPRWTGALALTSAAALAAVGTQALCAKDDPLHALLWHVAPLMLAAIAGAGLGRVVRSSAAPPRFV